MEDIAAVRRRFARRRVHDPEALIVSTISEHAESLLRVARRHTRCQADAEDAYQRALETFVKAAHRLEPSTVHKWLHTVVKHEALKRLKPHEVTALVLKAQGLSYHEIADRQGWTYTNVCRDKDLLVVVGAAAPTCRFAGGPPNGPAARRVGHRRPPPRS